MLADAERDRLRKYLMVAEGVRLKPYRDTVGKLTIGCGRNLDDVGLSMLEVYDLLNHDIDRAYVALVGKYPWFKDQDVVRQVVLTELCFNMGLASLSKFVNTLAAFERKDYRAATAGLRASKWYRQVGVSRSARILAMTVSGAWV